MQHLIHAAQNGDQKAFECLVTRFQDRVFALALAQLGNYHQAEDAVQEAFVEAYLRLGQLQSPAAFPAWLHKIVLGKCVRVLRTGKSVPAPVPLYALMDTASSDPDPEAALLEQAAREALRNAIFLLSEQEREAFVLFAVGGYRYKEIAQAMDIPVSLVRKRIYTARQRLRSGEELAFLRPSQRPAFSQHITRQVSERMLQRKEAQMPETVITPQRVDLMGPGTECKAAVKNLYTFYRYELLMQHDYEGNITPPPDVTEKTWYSGAWVNQQGVINGLHSATHDEAVAGEDAFWEWPNLQAYIICLNGWPAGFACIASPPNATRGVDYRLQEFFILNKARRRGVGTEAARLLFDRLPGRWELSYNPENLPGAAFWQKFIPRYTNGDFTEEMIGMGQFPDMPGYVFTKGARPQHPITVR